MILKKGTKVKFIGLHLPEGQFLSGLDRFTIGKEYELMSDYHHSCHLNLAVTTDDNNWCYLTANAFNIEQFVRQ